MQVRVDMHTDMNSSGDFMVFCHRSRLHHTDVALIRHTCSRLRPQSDIETILKADHSEATNETGQKHFEMVLWEGREEIDRFLCRSPLA